MSTKSAGLARKLGYTNIAVMLKGAPGWKKAGQQVVISDSFIQTGNIILVDLRSPEESAAGHIAGAVNIPFAELAEARDDFNEKAPVVTYGEKQDEATRMLAGWGIKGAALINGGLKGYLERGGQLVTGKPEIDIVWSRKLGKGEVDSEEFIRAAGESNGPQLVLDVRAPAETSEGQFAHAVLIPLDQLEARMAELPKDKEILVHCSTGDRAEMAHALLQKAGYRSRFLVAEVTCDGNDCTVR